MTEILNDLKTQYLGECDKILMLIRELRVDEFEFYAYEELQYGAYFPSEIKNDGEGIFFSCAEKLAMSSGGVGAHIQAIARNLSRNTFDCENGDRWLKSKEYSFFVKSFRWSW